MAKTPSIRIIICAVWLITVGTGFGVMLNYQNTAGEAGRTPSQWPADTALRLDPQRDTLVMFAHPKCPCTRASVEELNRIMAQHSGQVAAHVLFLKPAGYPDSWTQTGLWPSVAAIPGVEVREDAAGSEALRFGAETSGFLVLYDPRGKLLFKGGITGSRGHAGDNSGESAVSSRLAGQTVSFAQTPVFGCSLLGDCRDSSEETLK